VSRRLRWIRGGCHRRASRPRRPSLSTLSEAPGRNSHYPRHVRMAAAHAVCGMSMTVDQVVERPAACSCVAGHVSSRRRPKREGAMSRYASRQSSSTSPQSTSPSSRIPTQPRDPTYGGRKYRSGEAAINSS
jgi:hypothetical protein